jgi:hypothetical protein
MSIGSAAVNGQVAFSRPRTSGGAAEDHGGKPDRRRAEHPHVQASAEERQRSRHRADQAGYRMPSIGPGVRIEGGSAWTLGR